MKQVNTTFMVSGGGTGGHIFPAIAIANGLRARYPDASIVFVGALNKMEMQRVPEAGYPIYGLPITGFQRKLHWSNLIFPFRLIASLFQSWRLLRRYKPAAVIGVGGFASGPLLEMAYRLKIPTLIHDSNSYPGITNRLLARKADKVCVAFSGMERFFPAGRLVLTGNPVRKEIENNLPSREEACAHFKLDASKKVLLVLGGSLGAKTINQSIEQGLEDIEHHGVQLLWQTGKSYHGNARVKNGLRTTFIKDMHHAYAAADVVISRAGAMSVTELCLCGKPAILVPSPNVAEDHQTKNAMALVSNHAAVLVADKEARDELVQEALQLLSDEQRCAQLKMKIEKLAVRGATEKIVDQISELIGDQS